MWYGDILIFFEYSDMHVLLYNTLWEVQAPILSYIKSLIPIHSYSIVLYFLGQDLYLNFH